MADHLYNLRNGLIAGCNKALIKGLLDDLLEEKVLNDGEVEYIDERNVLPSDKMRALIDIVRKKGNKSSNIMIQKVSKRDLMLSEKLGITAPTEYPLPQQETKIESPSQKTPSEFPLPSQEQKVKPPSQTDSNGITLCLQEEYERICSTERDNKYPILPQKERTRRALIICNDKFDNCYLKERHGAEHDVKGMEQLLEGLGYKVLKRTNLTVREMRDTMRMFAAEQEHITSDSTFIVFMSHGQRDVICGTDSEEETNNMLHVDEIFTTFNNVNCRVLRDKPKVIIIQACRGGDKGQVLVADSACALPSAVQESLESDAMRMLQKERDFICFCSTTPDTLSWRDTQKGSLFILRLIEHMKVQFSFKDKVQMPTQERKTLMKKFYLFPGH
ncbi:PREDICTED: caspase-1-A-like [Nanorana parkeri]|uniref:caspase-1-A-like n=1 Tax=Nanorana parkeri TaxID=125878 RepID=UPI000854FE39|nr:PREDICTED: caspase-1-A-like [Nanorana parkeri]